jgi:hypothetical protein
MRKITQQAIHAFMNGQEYKKDNTEVEQLIFIGILKLHGNEIARRNNETGEMEISNAGWFSNTTKERLNGIPGVSIYQKKGQWYLNGEVWNGQWSLINPEA